MFPPDVISSHFDAGNPGCLSRDFLAARARSGAVGPPSPPSLPLRIESTSGPVNDIIRWRDENSMRAVPHTGCTRARTCIGLKKRSRHPLFLRGIDIPNLFLDVVPPLLKPRLSSSVSFFRSDSDRGWPTIENWEWNLISRWDALAWNGKDARQGNGSRCYPWWLPLDVTVRDWDFLLLDNFISHFILQLSFYFFSFA